MFKISLAERKFLEDGISQNIRGDGRNNLDYRHFVLETGILTQTNGSARVKLAQTDVLVGVKAEIGEPDLDSPTKGKVQLSVECCPSASPEFEGRGAEELNTELARVLERLLQTESAIDLTKLCIIPGKVCWILYVDAMVLDSGGNLFDAISVATRAALFNTTIPVVEVANDDYDVTDDPSKQWNLDVTNVPIYVTFCKIGTSYIVDATIEEELCVNVRLTIGVNKKGNICTVQKGAQGGLDPSSMYEMLNHARKIGQQLLQKLDESLPSEHKQERKLGFFAA